MAFFKAKDKEYFSFNLNPSNTERCYVFALNRSQISVSNHLVGYLLAFSIGIFLAVACIASLEFAGIGKYFFSDSGQELLLLILASLACVIVVSEFVFFLWIRRGRNSLMTENERKELKGIKMVKKKSQMIYIIFLLNMTVPLVAIFALPGGMSSFFPAIQIHGVVVYFCRRN